jgi:hypothetical protein
MGDFSNGTAAASKTRRPLFSRNPLFWFCIAYYLLAVLWGARGAFISERTTGDLLLQIALALCLGVWAVTDARQRHKPIPRSQQFWFLVLAGLMVPGYVIFTRGWKGIGWVILHAVTWMVIATLSMHLIGFTYFGSAWWAAMWGAE